MRRERCDSLRHAAQGGHRRFGAREERTGNVESTNDDIERAAGLVEAMIKKLGIDPASVSMAPPGAGRAWSLMRGSAAVAIFLRPANEGEDSARLRIVSPIVKVGADTRPELFRTLLELNTTGLGGMAFGIHQERVVLVAERRTKDLDAAEVEHLIQRVGVVADHYDDQLIQKFGGVRVSDL